MRDFVAGRRVHAVIGVRGSGFPLSVDISLPDVLGSDGNLEHARGCDESACASAFNAYNNFFAHPRAALALQRILR